MYLVKGLNCSHASKVFSFTLKPAKVHLNPDLQQGKATGWPEFSYKRTAAFPGLFFSIATENGGRI